MDVLQALLVCYAALLTLCSAVSCKLYLLYRTKSFLLLMLVWPLTLINFVLQGIYVESTLGSTLSFSTYFLTALCLSNILFIITGIPNSFNWKLYSGIYCTSLILSILLYSIGASFLITAAPIAIAIAVPQLHIGVMKLYRYGSKGPELSNIFAFTLILNGLHFLDYPILRPYPNAAIYGFSIVLIITILFSLLLPIILSNHNNNLLNKRLIDEMEQTKQLAKVKSDFLANMSHEIRTPINGIRGINDLLRASNLTTEQRHYCNIAHKSIEHLTNLVSDVLSLTHLESGKIVLHPESVRLKTIRIDLMEYYSINETSNNKNIAYNIACSADTEFVVDRGKVMQILFNLTTNAIKYTTGDKIKINLGIESPADNISEAKMIIQIHDNGEGIEEESQKAIFSEFNQLSPGKGGVGLGLSIVNRLIQALGGTITLKSNKLEGTTFCCHVPIEIVNNTQVETATITSSEIPKHDPQPKSSSQPSHVLAVEDDPTSQLILAAVFKKEGIIGTVVGTAELALEELGRSSFDLLITDINLPGMSGLELVKELRTKDSSIPIIIQSALAFEEDVDKAKHAGATSYLQKPITYKNIVDACKLNGIHTNASSRASK